jgi:adenylate cyclase
VIVPLSTVWVVTYAVLDLWWSAVIPLAYQVLSTVGLAGFLRTKHFQRFRTVELALMLLLPFVRQWSLGGFRTSSAVAGVGVRRPHGGAGLRGAWQAWWWLAGYVVLLVASTVLEFTAPDATELPQGVTVSFFFLNIGGCPW